MEVLTFLNQYAAVFLIALTLLALALFLRLTQLHGEIRTLKKKYTALTLGTSGETLTDIVTELAEGHSAAKEQIRQLEEEVMDLRKQQQSDLNHVAIMHYNAFDFTYGELSFSMAVLDDVGSGFIFTNIHNRDDARCYCKRILNGESKHPLSEEEKEVLEYALNSEAGYSRLARGGAK